MKAGPWRDALLAAARRAGPPLLLLAAIAVAAVALTRLLPPLAAANRLIDDLLLARLAPAEPQDESIVILGLRESTLATLACRSPIDRVFLAQLIERLEAKGVRAIGLDILLDAPTTPEADAALRDRLRATRVPLVLITARAETELSEEQRAFLDEFVDGLAHGFSNLTKDGIDATVRWHEPRAETGELSFPARLASLLGAAVPTAPFEIAWHGNPEPGLGAFAVYPAEAVELLPDAWLAGKIVLIGVELPDSDRHRTPLAVLDRSTPGVEIQAHVLSQLLSGRRHPRLPPAGELALALALAGLGGLIAGGRRSPALSAAAAPLGVAAFAALGIGFGLRGGPLLPLVSGSLAWLGGLAGMTGRAFWQERQERQTLMQLFSRHVSTPIAEDIWRQRASFMAGGRPKPQTLTATVLFSDIRDFTPVAERLGPEELIAWFELYLERMVAIVAAEHGLVLRFIGDALLVAYGVPVPRQSQAEIAADAQASARTALRMIAEIGTLNGELAERGLPPIGIRIGIYTGPLVAGSLGGATHVEYSLLGDTANTAARLETLGKQHPSPGPGTILLGGPTAELLGPGFDLLPAGEMLLKGKSQPVAIYRLLGDTAPGTAEAVAISTELSQSRL